MLELAAKGFLLSATLCLDLGIVNVAMIRTAMSQGTRPALALGLGSAAGDLVYAFLSIAAIALVLEHRPVRLVLWLGGTVVLAWLAVRMLREYRRPREVGTGDAPPPQSTTAASFGRGVLLALASPSAILWFAAVGGSVIAANARDRAALLPFMAGFTLAGVLWAVLVSAAVGRARHFLPGAWQRAIALVSALLFVYFALEVFVRGYREFVLA